ncbi:MAG: SH3 domain-containing protein [Rhodobacteraceae bacterium]|nr:SH3 domain-containing protein [Paracoccaceae bacterium]
MKRFILVSFAFLAVVFYQMSGGADFEPRVETIPSAAAAKITEAQSVAESLTQPLPKPDQVQAASLIARPPVTSSVTSSVTVPLIEPTPVTFVQPNGPVVEAAVSRVQNTPVVPDIRPFSEPLVLASLEQGLAGLTSAEPVPESAPTLAAVAPVVVLADIREITATRVNMRDGPGTTFPVLARLSLGHEVEVLGNSGDGWLRLRTLPEQQTGWISASLVSKAKR